MQHHNRIAARIPDNAQHFQIAVAALEHIEHMRLAAAIFNANARVLIAVKIRTGQFAFGLGDNHRQIAQLQRLFFGTTADYRKGSACNGPRKAIVAL
jgi:hypothetical protein